MAFNVSALTRPSARKVTGLNAESSIPIQWGCVIAAVILDYTAGAGGDRTVGFEVYDPSGVLVAKVRSPVVLTGGTTGSFFFQLGGVQEDALFEGACLNGLPTIPAWEGYTIRLAGSGYTLPTDDTVDVTVHLMR